MDVDEHKFQVTLGLFSMKTIVGVLDWALAYID